jgi:DNA-binding transcriptional MocR family regulator
LKKVLPEYQDRRDALLTSLAANMPPGVGWTRPNGGYCCWITLPKEHAFDDLYPAALRQGWAFAPGNVFLPPGAPYGPALRICFGQQPPFTIRAGVEALAQLIRTRMESTPKSSRELAEWSPIV